MTTEEEVTEIASNFMVGFFIGLAVLVGLLIFFLISIIVLCVKVRNLRKVVDSHASLLHFRPHEGTQHHEDELAKRYALPIQLPRAQHSELRNNQYPSNPNFPPNQSDNLKGEMGLEYGKHGPSMVMMHYPKPKRTNGHYH
ncbi:hypothetical protein PPYR_04896 [Photinus pyralis]|uniref:Uncharacterized protein n=1 Tax=Photinus pyralis TaxID=7054 RepID=A0A5N4A071_PHOPY|nr:uncharacterized protein LOC116162787 [Photinus pyralis]XP_031359475.1 uncharacterized protein LOC116183019 [Photinus pyralis]KAB0790724.1 hypothetical protein PPYR_15768 [Photinus pyralis]KAB0802710.1 hypothetical protein PPYR_04896 [Photinus pyralis]